MPFAQNSELPKGVKNLPSAAQTIWRKAFNAALKTYNGDDRAASRVAWAAVKRKYKKSQDGTWVAKSMAQPVFLEAVYRTGMKNGRPSWKSTASLTTPDTSGDEMDTSLYADFVQNFKAAKAAGTDVPFADAAHYSGLVPPALSTLSKIGSIEDVGVDGNRLKAWGYFDDTPIGRAAYFRAAAPESPIRTSIGFWPDPERIEHKSGGGRIFKGGEGKAKLAHIAFTAVPLHPHTDLEIEMKSRISTVGQDLKEVLQDDALVEELLKYAPYLRSLASSAVLKSSLSEDENLLIRSMATSFSDALAENAAKELIGDVQSMLYVLQDVLWNISMSDQVTDKVGAVKQAVDQFQAACAVMQPDMGDDMTMDSAAARPAASSMADVVAQLSQGPAAPLGRSAQAPQPVPSGQPANTGQVTPTAVPQVTSVSPGTQPASASESAPAQAAPAGAPTEAAGAPAGASTLPDTLTFTREQFDTLVKSLVAAVTTAPGSVQPAPASAPVRRSFAGIPPSRVVTASQAGQTQPQTMADVANVLHTARFAAMGGVPEIEGVVPT